MLFQELTEAIIGFGAQQGWHCIPHRSDKDLSFEDIEDPAQGCDQQHRPLILADTFVPFEWLMDCCCSCRFAISGRDRTEGIAGGRSGRWATE